MITVACVWVRGNVPYQKEYVTRLRGMVAKHLRQAHEFVCLTDRPDEIPEVQTEKILLPRETFGWWGKIELFRPGRFTDRTMYLDLDTLVVSALDPIVEYPSAFALIPHEGTFTPKGGYQVVRRFNSSVMVWNGGVPDQICKRWGRDVARTFWGDQDWIGHLMPEADTMPIEWFPRISSIQDGPVPAGAKVVLAKKPKNLEAVKRWTWARDAWEAA